MISSRLQQRLLSVRCVYSVARSRVAQPTQRRLASSSSGPRQPPAAKRTATPPPPSPSSSSSAAAATRARISAEKEAPPVETAEEYKARYKSAARRWTATVIALPILLVTSYYLFDRCTEFLIVFLCEERSQFPFGFLCANMGDSGSGACAQGFEPRSHETRRLNLDISRPGRTNPNCLHVQYVLNTEKNNMPSFTLAAIS